MQPQVEIDRRPYRQHMAAPLVRVTIWGSLEDSLTLWFELTEPGRRRLEPAGRLIGHVPREITTALRSRGYELEGVRTGS